tara:strand:- start:12588 stop:13340 length:753 start_codon:yes stop_codon:yes gene_type:complete
MGWFDEFINEQIEDAGDFFTEDIGKYIGGADNLGSTLLGLGLGYIADKSGIADPKLPVVGYQGSIPEYTAVRERVPMQADPNRRPGSTGRRYFSDTIFAQKPETEPMTVEQARTQAAAQAKGIAAEQPPVAAPVEKEYDPDAKEVGMAGPDRMYASGGIANLSQGRYLGGTTDGQADKVPARIDNGQEARLSDGEFVLPADLVALLGNGNSNAGARKLHEFMDRVRKQGTGKETQQKNIDAGKELSMLLK